MMLQSTQPAKKKSTPRVIVVIVAMCALLAGGTAGWWGWSTRAQGTPQAVEFTAAELSPELTGAQVLALGEATHGTAEFQQLRQQLTEKVVDKGFRTIVLEEDFGAVRRVDEFVTGGPGTAVEAAQRFGFAINQTQQVADWLQWVRDRNAGLPTEQRIRLIGMDVQRANANKQIALDYLQQSDPGQADRLRTALQPLDDDHRDAPGMGEPTQQLERAIEATAADRPGRTDALAAASALVDGVLLQQAKNYQVTRTGMMFANLERIVAERAAAGPVLLFGHDGHVAKKPAGALKETVGELAAKKWGPGYRVIGTDYVRVRFVSGKGADRTEFGLHNRTPLRGMYGGTRVGYLEFAATSGENRTLVDSTVAMGSVGEAYQSWMGWVPGLTEVFVVPSKLYDAVILVADGTPVTPLMG